MTSTEERIAKIELAIIGKWVNDAIAIFCHGRMNQASLATAFVGDKDLQVFGEVQYQVLIEENIPLLRIVNMTPTGEQSR